MMKCLASSFGSNRGLPDITVPLVLNYFAFSFYFLFYFFVNFLVKAACESCSLTVRGSVCGDISCCWSVLCNSVKGSTEQWNPYRMCWPGGEKTLQVDTDNRVEGK